MFSCGPRGIERSSRTMSHRSPRRKADASSSVAKPWNLKTSRKHERNINLNDSRRSTSSSNMTMVCRPDLCMFPSTLVHDPQCQLKRAKISSRRPGLADFLDGPLIDLHEPALDRVTEVNRN